MGKDSFFNKYRWADWISMQKYKMGPWFDIIDKNELKIN